MSRETKSSIIALVALIFYVHTAKIYGGNVTFPGQQVLLFNDSVVANHNNGSLPCPTVSDKDVISFVLENYTKMVRPQLNSKEPTVVLLAFHLYGIHDFIERENTLVLNANVDLSWVDQYLRWNHSWPQKCLRRVALPTEAIWLPDVFLTNSIDNPNFIAAVSLSVMIASDGTVRYSSIGQLATTCQLDLTFFPFDSQVCSLRFESRVYSNDRLQITYNKNNGSDGIFTILEQLWTDNAHWQLVANHTQFGSTAYHGGVFDKVIFFLVLRRKPLYYIVNIIVPSLVISVVEMSTFFLPLTEVVKVHISFTCLLAYSVFQTMIISDLPRSGDSVPLLCLYIDLQMAYIAISILAEGAVFFFYENSVRKRRIPDGVITAVRIVAIALLMSQNMPNPKPRLPKLKKPIFSNAYSQMTSDDRSSPTSEPNIKRKVALNGIERREMWLFIAEMFERINVISYALAITFTPIVFFGALPHLHADMALKLQPDFVK